MVVVAGLRDNTLFFTKLMAAATGLNVTVAGSKVHVPFARPPPACQRPVSRRGKSRRHSPGFTGPFVGTRRDAHQL
jgi:hypothetical protein